MLRLRNTFSSYTSANIANYLSTILKDFLVKEKEVDYFIITSGYQEYRRCVGIVADRSDIELHTYG